MTARPKLRTKETGILPLSVCDSRELLGDPAGGPRRWVGSQRPPSESQARKTPLSYHHSSIETAPARGQTVSLSVTACGDGPGQTVPGAAAAAADGPTNVTVI